MKQTEMTRLKLHEPVKMEISTWYGEQTVVASVYEINTINGVKYRIVNTEGNVDRINENEIISISDADLNEKMKNALVQLSKAWEKRLAEEQNHREQRDKILQEIQLATSELFKNCKNLA